MKCILPIKKPNTSLTTLTQHYYPEGGWGWVIVAVSFFLHSLLIGFIMSINCLSDDIRQYFGYYTDCLGSGCLAMSLIASPLIMTICKRKSTRLFSIISGLIVALGCLFASFANQFHQIVISFGTFFAIGVAINRDCSQLMIGQYFKKRRPLVEILIMSGPGFGFGIIPTIQQLLLNKFGWRLTMQIFAIVMSSVFFLSTLYRSASLYHPQRRAILHLKNQRRKIKDKYAYSNQQINNYRSFIDFSILQKTNIKLILFSNFIISFGTYTPLFSLTTHIKTENMQKYKLTILLILGISWIFGCCIFGSLLTIYNLSRQYLCQLSSFFISLTLIVFLKTNSNIYLYTLFSIMYGFSMGAYQYSLKMYIYEIAKSKKFAYAWSFVQFIQAIPIAVCIPIQETISNTFGNKYGYYFNIFTILIGTILISVIKNERTKHLLMQKSSLKSESDNCNEERDVLFNLQKPNQSIEKTLRKSNMTFDSEIDPNYKQESYSLCGEEISNVNFIDNYLIENLTLANNFNYDFITSCDKDEKFLMLSEFENNLMTIIPKSKTFSNN